MAAQTQELNALVVQYIDDQLFDGLEKALPLWNYLSKEGKKRQKGGIYIQFPIKLKKNASQGFIAGTGATVSASPSVQLQYGVLAWKYYNCNINFTLEDYNVAQDSALSVMDFFTEKIDGAMADMYRDLSSAIWNGSSIDPLAFEGIKDICAASGTAYAGLLDTDYTDDATAYLPFINSATTVSYGAINNMITNVQARMQQGANVGNECFGFANTFVYEKFKNAVQTQQMFINENEFAKAGFRGFMVNGVEFFLDAYTPGSNVSGTNDNWCVIFPKKAVKFIYNFGFDAGSPFDTTKEGLQLPTEPLKSVQRYLSGNLVCSNRRLFAVNKTFGA